jgi:hypothetical protein
MDGWMNADFVDYALLSFHFCPGSEVGKGVARGEVGYLHICLIYMPKIPKISGNHAASSCSLKLKPSATQFNSIQLNENKASKIELTFSYLCFTISPTEAARYIAQHMRIHPSMHLIQPFNALPHPLFIHLSIFIIIFHLSSPLRSAPPSFIPSPLSRTCALSCIRIHPPKVLVTPLTPRNAYIKQSVSPPYRPPLMMQKWPDT